MKTLFEQRFEDGLECIIASLTKKSGVKTYEKNFGADRTLET